MKKIILVGCIFLAFSIITIAIAFFELSKPLPTQTTQSNEKKDLQIKLPDTRPNLEFVSGTEYELGVDKKGGTIVKLTNWLGDGINTTCYEKILNPDTSTYLDWVKMTQQPEYYNYYINFTVPTLEGIYDMEVRCLVSNKNISIGKGFHVSGDTINDTMSQLIIGESYS